MSKIDNQIWYCYLLFHPSNRTYVGVTTNLDRRLRQHQQIIKGGAKYTTKCQNPVEWQRVCHLSGFPDHCSALQFEWKWKQLSRKVKIGNSSIIRRFHALYQLLNLERPTQKAQLYLDYPDGRPKINWIQSNISKPNQWFISYYQLYPVKLILTKK